LVDREDKAMTSIDPNFPGIFFGEVTAVTVTDPPTYTGQAGNRVLEPDRPFTISVEWFIDGPFAPIVKAAMAPNWTLRIFVESQGPGPEVVLVNIPVPVNSGVDAGTRTTWTYTQVLTPPHLQDGTLNKLIVVVRDTLPGPLDLAGFGEGPIVLMESGQP
jgi:hypothetical protein